ncbi:MAG: methyltransferase [Lachnospiraceae bacterium]|nr:methyltransferase [Lachnospiraceae bacterium]
MKQYLDNLKNGREVRESLASLCGLLRTSGESALSAGDAEALVVNGRKLLSAEDPKVRKNAAKLLGLIRGERFENVIPGGDAGTVLCLVDAYRAEQTRFVKSAYLEALAGRDISSQREFLMARLTELRETEVTDENRKHVNEEIAALQKLLSASEGKEKLHRFTGYDADNTILFVINPCYREMFAESLGGMRKKIVGGGVVVRTTKLSEILPNRIWREAVFRIPELLNVAKEPYEAAAQLAGDIVWNYLATRLSVTEATLRYRVDFRCRDEAAKNRFVKRISQETDRLSGGRLVNSTGDYEVTFRISETDGDSYRLGILFAGLRDKRFDYRRETVASSIHPTDAAAVIAAAKPYFSEDAQVLDPFCGAGTMIAERMQAGKIRTAFGVDTFGPAIEKARGNVKTSNVWFVHRDFFDYRQDHMFDEIITNMPFKEEGGDEIALLYRRFFRKLPEHLRQDGTLVMVSHDPKLAETSVPADMTIVRKIPMRERGEMAAYIIRFRGLA